MRPLFLSERHLITSIVREATGVTIAPSSPVIAESHDSGNANAKPRFNCDFSLEFVDCSTMDNFVSFARSVLPNTIGADVFVTVDKDSLAPLVVTMQQGAAFPIRYFRNYVAEVESLLRTQCRHSAVAARASIGSLDASGYCRILVVGNEITFLVYPQSNEPVNTGSIITLHEAENAGVQAVIDSNSIVAIDGWLKTATRESDYKLWAVPN